MYCSSWLFWKLLMQYCVNNDASVKRSKTYARCLIQIPGLRMANQGVPVALAPGGVAPAVEDVIRQQRLISMQMQQLHKQSSPRTTRCWRPRSIP
jgi:hypothetical protein